MVEWKFISLKTFFLSAGMSFLGIFSLLFTINLGEPVLFNMSLPFILSILLLLGLPIYIALYIAILVDIIKKGSRTMWILFWIVCLILFPLSLLFTIVYLSIGKDVVTPKTLTEKARVNINLSGTKDIKDLDRPIRKSKSHEYCSECGKPIKKGAKFCEHCGEKQ